MRTAIIPLFFLLVLWVTCCSSNEKDIAQDKTTEEQELQETTEGLASVTDVSISGEENQYTFSITVSSPDLGCQ